MVEPRRGHGHRRAERLQRLEWADSAEAASAPSLEDLRAAVVHGTGDERIGRVGEVYLDDLTGVPEWVSVRTGRFGTSERFVPLGLLDLDGGVLRVPYTADRVHAAPRLHVDGDLTPREELELRRHYGVADQGSTGDGSGLSLSDPPAPAHVAPPGDGTGR